MKHLPAWSFALFAFALLGAPALMRAEDAAGFSMVFRPQSVNKYDDMPEDLAKAYPNALLAMITFQPMNHASARNGSNVQDGEGGWFDRGMKPDEPGKIRFLVPEQDQNLLLHTLKTSEGPFVLKVRNSRKGYFETVPLLSPHLDFARPRRFGGRFDLRPFGSPWAGGNPTEIGALFGRYGW